MRTLILSFFLCAAGLAQPSVQTYGPTEGELQAHDRCLMWYAELHDDTPVRQACPKPCPVINVNGAFFLLCHSGDVDMDAGYSSGYTLIPTVRLTVRPPDRPSARPIPNGPAKRSGPIPNENTLRVTPFELADNGGKRVVWLTKYGALHIRISEKVGTLYQFPTSSIFRVVIEPKDLRWSDLELVP